MLHQLKYQKQQAVSEFIGLLAWQHLSDHSVFDWAQCIVPIPLHPSKEKLRGYNQLDGFGKYLSQKSGIPYYKGFLIKAIKSDTQRSEEHTSELQSRPHLVCRLLLEKKKKKKKKK